MIKMFGDWYHRYFSDEEAVVLVLLLLGLFGVIILLGQLLAPVFTALVIAYLMMGMVQVLTNKGVPYIGAVWVVFLLFIGALVTFTFVLMPLIWGQLRTLLEQLPAMLGEGQRLLALLPNQFPEVVTYEQVDDWIGLANQSIGKLGTDVVSFSVANLPNVLGILIFLVLVPVLVFFFMKDKDQLAASFVQFLPKERPTIDRVWAEMNDQISNYVRGKVIEIIIVGGVTYIAFVILGVKYAALLGLLVGLSVVVPYIGAAVVTIPVAAVAYFQFGLESSDFVTVMVVYGIIQALDGNVLVPLLFSEAVNLHPVAIIVAVLLFGGIWGLWGVFFAIPLATLIKAVFRAWPKPRELDALPDS